MSYHTEIEDWLDELLTRRPDEIDDQGFARVLAGVKAKLLESYRNGQKAGPRPSGEQNTERSAERSRRTSRS